MRRRFLSGPGACTGGVEGVEEVVRGGAAGAQCRNKNVPSATRLERSRSAHGMRTHMDGRRAYPVPGGVDMTSPGGGGLLPTRTRISPRRGWRSRRNRRRALQLRAPLTRAVGGQCRGRTVRFRPFIAGGVKTRIPVTRRSHRARPRSWTGRLPRSLASDPPSFRSLTRRGSRTGGMCG